ncbi:MAG TPA: hemolysin family protein [Ruania sp.]|nr:hemolysin family protein [Ruania sp.]
MDGATWGSIGLVLLFIVIGGIFAGTEFALVSLRESQIRRLSERGPRGLRVASVARDPNRFLSAVQIGVTVAGFFSAAYGASTLAPDFAPLLVDAGIPEAIASTVALVLLTLIIAYGSLVLGELVPKRLALQRSEQFALVVAPPLDRFATLMRPVIWLLSRSTNGVVRLLGGDPSARSEELSDEELRDIVLTHETLPDEERRILSDVFRASDRTVAEVMRPRGEVTFLDSRLTLDEAGAEVRGHPYSRYPVTGADFDDVLGMVHVRDILQPAPGTDTSTVTVAAVTRPILPLPSTNKLLHSLSAMRRHHTQLAVVVDEYGGTDGILTMEDMMEELIGDIRDEYDPVEPRRADGTYDAGITIEDFTSATGVELADGPYETVAGYVLTQLGRLARPGDRVQVNGSTLEVARVEGKRIRVVRIIDTAPQHSPA